MEPSDRPSMTKVIVMLEGNIDDLKLPPRPFFSSPQHVSIVEPQSDSSTELLLSGSQEESLYNNMSKSCLNPNRSISSPGSSQACRPVQPNSFTKLVRHLDKPRRLILLSQPDSQYLARSAKTLTIQKLKKLGRQLLKRMEAFTNSRKPLQVLGCSLAWLGSDLGGVLAK
ncbi:hypothetical protein CK203_070733 [Vitis vinifera]|uniref:Uncharacterized protein n=1 Tax=Vitis vinifera TaxID=29760 RepID=A0A438C1X1_VITVI|nr:hypothetical protein CK203_070733 [Vitis vinifera]